VHARTALLRLLLMALSSCSDENSCQFEGEPFIDAGGVAIGDLEGCSNESPPTFISLEAVEITYRPCVLVSNGSVACVTIVIGPSTSWGGEPCGAGLTLTTPGFHVRFNQNQMLDIHEQWQIRNPESDVSKTGVVRDAASQRIMVGVSTGARPEFFESEWFSGLTLEYGGEACDDDNKVVLRTPAGEQCTVYAGAPRTCTLWGESYDVHGRGPPINFVVTRPDLMIPGEVTDG
jgi:hypothetical protein